MKTRGRLKKSEGEGTGRESRKTMVPEELDDRGGGGRKVFFERTAYAFVVKEPYLTGVRIGKNPRLDAKKKRKKARVSEEQEKTPNNRTGLEKRKRIGAK